MALYISNIICKGRNLKIYTDKTNVMVFTVRKLTI